jgi:MFS family permease
MQRRCSLLKRLSFSSHGSVLAVEQGKPESFSTKGDATMDHLESDASLPEGEHMQHVEPTALPLEATAVTPLATAAAATALDTTPVPDVSEQLRPGRWQYMGLGLALLSVTMVWGGGLQVLLPQQVAVIAGNSGKVVALGLVTGISALVALAWAPIAGFLSDRTRSRLGRRNIWVLLGGIATALLLLFIGQAGSIPLLLVFWCVIQLTTNASSAALSAVIPERFPISRRGTISAITGIASLLGTFVGVAIAGLTHSLTAGWITIAVVSLVLGGLWALTAREPAEVKEAIERAAAARSATRDRASGAKRRLDLPRNADYWWAFAGRFLIFLGVQALLGYQLYILSDYIHLGQTNPGLPVATGVVILSGIFTVAILPSTGLAGWLSDKIGRVKPFVFITSLGFALPMVILLLWPTWPGILVAWVILGLAFGSYLSVDQALMSRVLPNIENAARDLGILNIANAGPQVLSPVFASIVISLLGGYRTLFIIAIVLVILGALSVRLIRSVN